jgi:signal transduction histidine kinase
MLRLVIYSLISNAMDFIPLSRQGQIEFGMFHRNSQKVFFVRDNGTGFSNTQAKRLFDAFRDSPQDSNLPQDTTSLATAKRIIHRHGGQIWAEGVEDTGGTIYFTCETAQPWKAIRADRTLQVSSSLDRSEPARYPSQIT